MGEVLSYIWIDLLRGTFILNDVLQNRNYNWSALQVNWRAYDHKDYHCLDEHSFLDLFAAVSGHLWTPVFTSRLHVSWHFSLGFTQLSYSICTSQSMTGSASCYCNESLNSIYFIKCICKHIISRARKTWIIMFRTCVIKKWEKQTKKYRRIQELCCLFWDYYNLYTHSFCLGTKVCQQNQPQLRGWVVSS